MNVLFKVVVAMLLAAVLGGCASAQPNGYVIEEPIRSYPAPVYPAPVYQPYQAAPPVVERQVIIIRPAPQPVYQGYYYQPNPDRLRDEYLQRFGKDFSKHCKFSNEYCRNPNRPPKLTAEQWQMYHNHDRRNDRHHRR